MISTFWTATCTALAASPAAGGESNLLWLVWGAFLLFVLTMVMLDLGVFHRHAHVISTREALAWTVVWVLMAMAFNVLVYFLYEHNWLGWTDIAAHQMSGREAATVFFTGYVLEKSLSADNIFVIAMIFSSSGSPARSSIACCSGASWAPSSCGA